MDLGVAVGTAVAFDDELDAILLEDPGAAYDRMDRTSKLDYQSRVRMWARRSRRPPADVAKTAVDLANSANLRHGPADRRAHVGYFLTDSGIAELARSLDAKLELHERIRLHFLSNLFAYCTTIFLICAAYGVLSVWLLGIELPWPGKALLALATALYISRIIPGWVSLLFARVMTPRWMPRMDFSAGIPDTYRTLVVVPCLLASREGIHRLAQTLERMRDNNASADARYALLSDFIDSPTEHADDDDALLEEARAQISILNERHGGGFMLLHRARRWNAAEDRWMGWERKRGKLEELNGYIVGGPTPFHTMHGDTATLASTRYVVTLDDDNAGQTPGAIHKLAGALAHPLNRPVLSEDGTRVEAGFSLLQPRVMVSLPRDFRPSRLEMLFNAMLEIETSEAYRSDDLPIVDVDQDVFGQSTYFGKGIYDVAMFHRMTHGLIAENTILSHDALEGGLVRSGVVTDVLLHETFVPTFHNSMTRTHRWQRGDWQLIPWLFPTIRNSEGVRVPNPLSSFGRWIIVHNVMRILFPTVALICFLAGWATSRTPGLWTLNLLAVAWIPAIIGLLIGSIRTVLTGRFRTLFGGLWAALSMRSAQFIFAVDNAQNSFDAAARATYRMVVSRRKLLEWTASIIESARPDPTLPQYARIMWFSPAFALGTVIFVGWINPVALSSAIPFAILWASAPLVAWWWSQKPESQPYSAQPSPP